MNMPMVLSGPTMSSLDLLNVINASRQEHEQSAIRRNDFHARVVDELEGEFYETFVIPAGPSGGRPSQGFRLNHDQCLLVSMRESKAVRRSVLEKLKLKEQPYHLPASMAEALRLAADQAERIEQQQREIEHAIATKAQISSSREASVMGKLSAASRKMKQLERELGRNSEEATVTAVEKAMGCKYGKQGFQPLKKWCKANNIVPNKVPCPRYGEVVAWPAMAWMECYRVDLAELFGREDSA
ncbi:hypothetical protein [Vreelandella indica]|uniref:hypothetical protein n=1 Tax=Vreelandella indica TaxID=3126500 RepID=UPI00300DFE72